MPNEQIIVEIIADSSQLQPTIDILAELGQVDKAAAESFKKTNAEFANRAKLISQVTAETKKQIPTLQQVEKNLSDIADGMVDAMGDAAVDMVKKLVSAETDLTKVTAAQTKATNEQGSASETLKKKLRDMTAQLALLKLEGKSNTEQYRQLRQQAGELADTIGDVRAEISTAGSDTSGLDKTLRSVNAVAGGFAVAQGATALFGEQGKSLDETLVKLQSTMSVLNGLQAIQEELSKEDDRLPAYLH